MDTQDGFVRVAGMSDVPLGKAIAVRVEDRSVAVFNHEGTIYATDNQCPHMGYPLIRGRARNGVLQCDWHGWSYAMAGGGCFTGGCDDLDTFPVEVRGGRHPRQGRRRRLPAHWRPLPAAQGRAALARQLGALQGRGDHACPGRLRGRDPPSAHLPPRQARRHGARRQRQLAAGPGRQRHRGRPAATAR